MKIGLVIGALGRGGSERQLSELAVGLSERGHAVEVVSYDGRGPLDAFVESKGVPVRVLESGSRLAKFRGVRRWMHGFQPHVVHGFMKRASSVAILANLPRRCPVIASDLSTATYGRRKPVLWAALVVFALADRVATQTERNRESLNLLAPWLKAKTVVVRNGVDTDRFRPVERQNRQGPFRFACVGTVYRVKNPVRVVEAAIDLRRRNVPEFRLDWFGRLGLGGDARPSYEYGRAVDLARRAGIESLVTFHGETAAVEEAYCNADALVHVSLQEGIPNAVVEGMSTGLPLVISRVSDLPLIVAEARNGFVCNETSPVAIADAMQRIMESSERERLEMGHRSRELAVHWFAKDRFVSEYEALYGDLSHGNP